MEVPVKTVGFRAWVLACYEMLNILPIFEEVANNTRAAKLAVLTNGFVLWFFVELVLEMKKYRVYEPELQRKANRKRLEKISNELAEIRAMARL